MDELTASLLGELVEPEDEALRAARARGEEADIQAVSPQTGAVLRFFARLLKARHVVEVGSGSGYSGLWLLGGMDLRGALTTVEADPDRQALAQRAYAEARLSDRVRSMLGAALVVLPKLADANYDVVLLDAAPEEFPEHLPHARRLLRPGGLLLAVGVPLSNEVSTPQAEGFRALIRELAQDAELTTILLPFGDGLLAAIKA